MVDHACSEREKSRAFKTLTNRRALSATKHKTPHQGLAKHMAQVDAVLARCSAAHREELEQTSSAAVAASQDAARKHERSQRVAIARCLRRLGCQVDSAGDETVELVAVASTSYGATNATPRAPPPPVATASTPKPGRRRGGAKAMPAVV